ncbi:hypothetical protein [Ascidiimonas sp. W6]|uniref:hypothetical protein n=1 Tax=Ascidiimonas meishanensis TaxID=3128903 RepID=UPI0030EE810D
MDLDEMKEVWAELSQQAEQQKKLNTQMIEKMTELQYKNRINKIIIPELIGGVVCAAIVIFIVVNFQKLEHWYLIMAAIVSIAILTVLPILSFRSLKNLYNISPVVNNYKEVLIKYNKGKRQVKFVQKLSIYLSFILMFALMPVSLKLFSNKDLSQLHYEKLLWAAPLGILFVVLMTRWVFKYYKNVIKGTDTLLAELEKES